MSRLSDGTIEWHSPACVDYVPMGVVELLEGLIVKIYGPSLCAWLLVILFKFFLVYLINT